MTERVLAMLLQDALLLSVGVLLVAALRPLLLKRLGAGSAYAAWLLVPALLLTPALPRPTQEPLRVVIQATGTAATAPAAFTAALPTPLPGQTAPWLALWLAGAVLVAAVQAWRQWRLARQGPQLPAGSSPALVGLLRPRVALPVDFEQRFSSGERELILAHEQVHRARGDNAWNLLACALTAIHWWNPLAWWARRRMQADQELACDAAVLAGRPDALPDYTRALLAAHDLDTHGAPLASRWGSTHPLVERIEMLNRSQPLNRRRMAALGAALLLIAGVAYGVQAETPAPAAAAPTIELDVEMLLVPQDGSAPSPLGKTSRLLTEAGLPTAISVVRDQDPPVHWDIVFFPTLAADNQIRLVAMFQDGQPLQRNQIDVATLPQGTWTERRIPSVSGGPDLLIRRKVRVLSAEESKRLAALRPQP